MIFRTFSAILLLLACACGAAAQSDVPVISGGAGLLGSREGGATLWQPVVAPVLALPLGERWLIESRADLREVAFSPAPGAPYQTRFFPTLEYAQIDFNLSSHLTIVAGRFLTPFNMYTERFSPVWIHNFQDAPFIVPIGTLTTGSNDGVEVRGLVVSANSFQVNYTAYFSALSNTNQLQSGRAAGGRAGVFIPKGRLELGVSFQRLLQTPRMNSVGGYLSFQPESVPLDVRSEYAHSPRGHGYWLEGAYRFSRYRGRDSLLGRLQAIGRVERFWRLERGSGDFLPAEDARRIDFGWNYYLPHEVRLNASYGRQFSPAGNFNAWNFGVTYRFLFPLFPGGQR